LSPWFRKKRTETTEQAAPEAPAPQLQQPAARAASATPDGGATTESAAAKKRRRGSRGGRGRKKPGEGATAGAERTGQGDRPARAEQADKADKPEKKPGDKPAAKKREPRERPERERSQRQERRSQQRRRPPEKRAPLPAAKRELLISVDVGEQRVAILEDDRVAEVYLERPEKRSIAGNIYLGTVDNVLPGMEAAFVEIGLEKNGFLYVDEIVVPELEGKRHHGKKIQDLIARGQTILVQAVKDPMKTKGARLTTDISLPGRFLVFVPQGEGLGVSRRLDDAERARLKDIIKGLDVKEGGIIVRTAAEGASAEDVERDLVFLQRLWKTIQAKAKGAKAPALVYQEAELPLRIVRDLFTGDFEQAYVDNDRAYKRIVGYLKKTSPHMLERVQRYKEKEPLLEAYGVDAEIRSTLNRRVDLPSGGYLVFDYAEAFTVIDVNTGRFVGSRSKTSGARLEDTITKNNLEAVKEVVRQLRLRDIGGIIVIDFIDMANPKNRAQVEEALRNELERDRTKTYVVEISPLGLVEMTRQNVTDGPREILTKRCPTCEGDGIVVSETTVAMDLERRLRTLAAGSRAQAFRVELHPKIAAILAGPGATRLAEIEAAAKKRFFFVPLEGTHLDHLVVLTEGKLEDLKPTAPVEEGAELQLQLGEVARHDGSAAVGKVDGLEVIVAGAAKLVGKKAKVRIERVVDEKTAYAVPLSGVAQEPEPITFESEAEKPTRAPSRTKKAVGEPAERDPEAGAGAAAVLDETELEETELEDTGLEDTEFEDTELEDGVGDAEPDADDAGETDDAEPAAVDADGTPVKKKTRRGSRGGRGRKKPATAGATTGADIDADAGPEGADDTELAEAGDEPQAEQTEQAEKARPPRAARTPRIHVPSADLTEDGEVSAARSSSNGDEAAAKKKTRRGTRGGRGRKKPAGTGAAALALDESENGADPSEAPEQDVAAAFEAPADAAFEAELEPQDAEEAGAEFELVEVLPLAAGHPRERDEQPAADEAPDEDSTAASADAQPSETGYVPMSEWLDEFER
jgi:ribonuclease G